MQPSRRLECQSQKAAEATGSTGAHSLSGAGEGLGLERGGTCPVSPSPSWMGGNSCLPLARLVSPLCTVPPLCTLACRAVSHPDSCLFCSFSGQAPPASHLAGASPAAFLRGEVGGGGRSLPFWRGVLAAVVEGAGSAPGPALWPHSVSAAPPGRAALAVLSPCLPVSQALRAMRVGASRETDSEKEFHMQGVYKGGALGSALEEGRGRSRCGRGRREGLG